MMNTTCGTVHINNKTFFWANAIKVRIRVFEEEEIRIRIFALIPCQNFRRRDFCIIIDVGNTANI